MATVEVPVTMLMRVDSNDLPPGAPGPAGGVLQQRTVAHYDPVEVANQNQYVATGILATVTIANDSWITARLDSIGGHNVIGGAVQFQLWRNGAPMPLPFGPAHGAVRTVDSKDFATLTGQATEWCLTGTHEVEVYALQSSGDVGAKGYLGRRAFDLGFAVGNILTLEVVSSQVVI